MPLDPEMQDVLDFIASRGVPPHYRLSPQEARQNMEKARTVFGGEEVALPRVEDRSVMGPGGQIPLRIYSPRPAGDAEKLPMLAFFHGGGWVMGSLHTHDGACRRLARDAGCMVISVDYRLAPEHRFSEAVMDAVAALVGIHDLAAELGGDPARLAVGGDSAGGNLAAVAALLASGTGFPPIAFQLLIYPVVTCDYTTASMKANAEGQLLTLEGMKWFWGHYLNDPADVESPLACPLKAPSLAGLPPAHVVTAEYDPLLDEGEAYALRLEQAGVPVTSKRYEGLMHGFLNLTSTRCVNAAIAEIAAMLHAGLG